eukprot:TRINITY_DN3440_c0_g1_i1.p1 TRINITY_DN3440_c0_g1~~TRINITY_DN3440_c0_g1_i1.p1  ORF type:complete len:300 (+),score=91.18 TRINITY_DN3440_c0_g1_i1:60-959(+)
MFPTWQSLLAAAALLACGVAPPPGARAARAKAPTSTHFADDDELLAARAYSEAASSQAESEPSSNKARQPGMFSLYDSDDEEEEPAAGTESLQREPPTINMALGEDDVTAVNMALGDETPVKADRLAVDFGDIAEFEVPAELEKVLDADQAVRTGDVDNPSAGVAMVRGWLRAHQDERYAAGKVAIEALLSMIVQFAGLKRSSASKASLSCTDGKTYALVVATWRVKAMYQALEAGSSELDDLKQLIGCTGAFENDPICAKFDDLEKGDACKDELQGLKTEREQMLSAYVSYLRIEENI